MRKCIRCGSIMKENCAVKVEGAGYGLFCLLMNQSCLVAGWENLKWRFARNVEKFPFIWMMLRDLRI